VADLSRSIATPQAALAAADADVERLQAARIATARTHTEQLEELSCRLRRATAAAAK
jgi:hypothetical protein